jgi:hypothetical protein
MSRLNLNETCTTDLREALYLLSLNYKFVRLETIRSQTQFKITPFFSLVFAGEGIVDAQHRYMGNESCRIDFSKLKDLAEEITSYMKSREDYSI